ncbi:MAG TPA: glycosyltransferase family 4 protein [Isosphaeraceae bacterium]|jgi:glycosyltransferase involved in cell wall biosynthesis|nr:glycosyltransferase family 4 protein [Isosphaeraceae bacterium]
MPEPPVRVCYVVSYFHPFASGAERQALAQGAELAKRGHVVHVVTHWIPAYPREDVVRGIRIHRWVNTSKAGPLFGISFVAGVIRALRRLRSEFDVVHTHQGLWEAVATGAGRGWLRGAPTLVQPASSGSYGEARELARTRGSRLLRRLILRNQAFAAISADIEREWQALGVPADRIVRMASGVDAEHFRPGPSRLDSHLPHRPRVVYTGRLHAQKNLSLLIEAWRAVVASTGAHLILVGGGLLGGREARAELEAQARSLSIADHVHFTGTVADPAEYLRAADAFVLPSVAEGMSNSLLEAMATGLPCLASSIGGNTDLLTDGKTGLLVPPNDRDAWSNALTQVVRDKELARRLGAAARGRVENEFALTVVVDRYLELYRRLLGEGSVNEG